MSWLGQIFTIGGMIIGGIIGSYIPGIGTSGGIALGGCIGGSIGGYFGNVLFADKPKYNTPPPQPHENRVQISTYGKPIPIVYESSRLAGNIIYMQPVQVTLVQDKHRADGVRYFSYVKTYSSTFAIAFCEGPVSGVSRIWVNSEIFADYRDPDGPFYPAGSVSLASANLSTSIAREEVYYTIYNGTATQDADPALSAILGEDNTPAYRNICYIVFRDFPIGEFTGIPQIEVEIGPQMSDPCSDYFIENSSSLDDTFWDGPNLGSWETQGGLAILRHTAPMPDWQTIGDILTLFTYDGDFDVEISWSITNISADTGGWLNFFVQDSNGYIGLYFGNQSLFGGVEYWWEGPGGYDSAITSDRGGKFRLVRVSGTITGFLWNSGNGTWDGSGIVLANGFTDSAYICVEAYVSVVSDPSQSAIIYIDEYKTNSGCDETTWP